MVVGEGSSIYTLFIRRVVLDAFHVFFNFSTSPFSSFCLSRYLSSSQLLSLFVTPLHTVCVSLSFAQINRELLLKLAHCVRLPLLTLIGVDNFIVLLLSGKYETKKKEPNENQIQFHFFGQFSSPFLPSSVIAPINGVERNDSGEVEGGRMVLGWVSKIANYTVKSSGMRHY